MHEKFEKILAFHGAPTLAGLKDGTVISLPKKSFAELDHLLTEYRPCFNCRGIEITTLGETQCYVLIFIYRKVNLCKTLNESRVAAFLQKLGYDPLADLKDKIEHLKIRICGKKEYPHEIGLFLGVPYEDVLGFLSNKGHEFKMNGYWKVYSNVYEAAQTFYKFTQCSENFCKRLQNGENLISLLKVG